MPKTQNDIAQALQLLQFFNKPDTEQAQQQHTALQLMGLQQAAQDRAAERAFRQQQAEQQAREQAATLDLRNKALAQQTATHETQGYRDMFDRLVAIGQADSPLAQVILNKAFPGAPEQAQALAHATKVAKTAQAVQGLYGAAATSGKFDDLHKQLTTFGATVDPKVWQDLPWDQLNALLPAAPKVSVPEIASEFLPSSYKPQTNTDWFTTPDTGVTPTRAQYLKALEPIFKFFTPNMGQ